MSDSNSLVYAVWTADLSGCYGLSGMHCKSYAEINPNARGFPFDEGNRWDIRKVIQREIVSWSYLLVQGLSVTTGHNLAPTCQMHTDYISGSLQSSPVCVSIFKLLFQIILLYLSLLINSSEEQISGLGNDSVALNTKLVYTAMPLPTQEDSPLHP